MSNNTTELVTEDSANRNIPTFEISEQKTVNKDSCSVNERCELNKNKIRRGYWIQYLITITVSMAMGIVGVHFGWISPTLPILFDSANTPIPTTRSQAAWISGCLQIGSVIGPFVGFYLCDTFGRRAAVIFCTIPNLISFVIIYLANGVWMLYLARLICGFAVGIAFVVIPIYISEISAPKIRGQLGILPGITFFAGTLLEYCIVPVLSIQMNAVICFILTIIQTIMVLFIPDTPYFHIMKDQHKKAEKVLQFLRQKDSIADEMEELKQGWELQKQDQKNYLDIFRTRLNQKCLFIASGIMVAQQLSGIVAINSYTLIILQEANAPISSQLGAIILAGLNIVFTIVATVFVDRWGRKPLLISSTLLVVFPLILIGFFYNLKSTGYEHISDFSLIPIFGLVIYLFGFAIGLGALPFSYTSEIFATKYKATAATLLSVFGSLLGLIVTKFYQIVSDSIGIQYSLWYFALCCIFMIIFIIEFVPETKGKTLEQIQVELKSTSNRIVPSNP